VPPKKKTDLIIGIIAGVVLLLSFSLGGVLLLNKDDESNNSARPKSSDAENDSAPDSTATLMKKIRATDPCSVHDRSFLKRFGPDQVVRLGTSLGNQPNGCVATTGKKGDPSEDFFVFELVLGYPYAVDGASGDSAEDVAGHEAFRSRSPKDPTGDTCSYNLPYPDLDFSVNLRVRRVVPDSESNKSWPERCEVARDYLAKISDKALTLTPRKQTLKGRTIIGKDPCAARSEIVSLVEGWKAAPVKYVGPYECRIELTEQGEAYRQAFIVMFDLGATPTPETSAEGQQTERVQLGGLEGVRSSTRALVAGGSACDNTMIIKPADPEVKNSAQLAVVTLQAYGSSPQEPPAPAPSCDQVNQATEIVLRELGS